MFRICLCLLTIAFVYCWHIFALLCLWLSYVLFSLVARSFCICILVYITRCYCTSLAVVSRCHLSCFDTFSFLYSCLLSSAFIHYHSLVDRRLKAVLAGNTRWERVSLLALSSHGTYASSAACWMTVGGCCCFCACIFAVVAKHKHIVVGTLPACCCCCYRRARCVGPNGSRSLRFEPLSTWFWMLVDSLQRR